MNPARWEPLPSFVWSLLPPLLCFCMCNRYFAVLTACALGTLLSYHMYTTFSSDTENWGSKKFMLSFKDLGERNLQLGQITEKESGDFLWTFFHRQWIWSLRLKACESSSQRRLLRLSFCAKR
jgi:hypothetical protein